MTRLNRQKNVRLRVVCPKKRSTMSPSPSTRSPRHGHRKMTRNRSTATDALTAYSRFECPLAVSIPSDPRRGLRVSSAQLVHSEPEPIQTYEVSNGASVAATTDAPSMRSLLPTKPVRHPKPQTRRSSSQTSAGRLRRCRRHHHQQSRPRRSRKWFPRPLEPHRQCRHQPRQLLAR